METNIDLLDILKIMDLNVCVCVWNFLHSFMELYLDTMSIFNVFYYVLISLTTFFLVSTISST
jgi:hypothetical protein